MRTFVTVPTLVTLAVCCNTVAQVHFRGETDARDLTASSVDAEGVLVVEDGTKTLIGLDRVRDVAGESASDFEPLRPTSDRIWRARYRLERSDWPSAEPLFEELFDEYASRGGPTASVVAEGLLRCRLRRGAHTTSLPAWLAWVRIQETGQSDGTDWIGGRIDAGTVLDVRTSTAPALPPIWLDGPALEAFIDRDDVGSLTEGSDVATEFAALYRHAARFENLLFAGADLTELQEAFPEQLVQHPGVDLVRDIVMARTGTPAQRVESRSRLRARLEVPTNPAWVEVWCRAGLGRSLILERDAPTRRRGLLELLHVPARFGRDHPYLAGIALAETARSLRELGDEQGALSVRTELFDVFPEHPACTWKGLDAQ